MTVPDPPSASFLFAPGFSVDDQTGKLVEMWDSEEGWDGERTWTLVRATGRDDGIP